MGANLHLARHLSEEIVDVHSFGTMPKFNYNFFVIEFSNKKRPWGFLKNDILKKKWTQDFAIIYEKSRQVFLCMQYE